ncbi:GNAT family N-acetyltransferase [Saccharicrinis sp. FJH54]|uniref:GNAT family N-acetyltransferase n=1 Tax=Saccharicrinis sp. FJH54 TaxID=3344665 RepID=UPI0035D40146
MDYTIQPYRKGQEQEISRLIRKVYDEFVAPDYTENGNTIFYDWIAPEKIAKRQKDQINLLVASIGTVIAGMIEIRDNRNVTLLFVDKKYHGKGMAGALFRSALQMCLSRDKDLDTFYVHASPFSIPVYERLGFKASGEIQEEQGITYLPMVMDVCLYLSGPPQNSIGAVR